MAELSNPEDWNRYSYVQNNPIRYNDPSGHRRCENVDDDGQCIDSEWENKLLQKKLDKFIAPEKVRESDMRRVGNKFTGFVTLTPGEYELLKNRGFPVNLYTLARMRDILINARGTTETLFPELRRTGWHNDPADAFRHAYWNALITREFGADFASQFTTAHETRFDSVREEAFMDLHNNQVGIEIGLANPDATDEELQVAVLESLRSGQLYVWDGANIYYSNQCPDCR